MFMSNKISIVISEVFSRFPGPRYPELGKGSGEEFRVRFIEPLFREVNNKKIIIDFTGTKGQPVSFIEEAFGGMCRILCLPRQEWKDIKGKSSWDRLSELAKNINLNHKERSVSEFIDNLEIICQDPSVKEDVFDYMKKCVTFGEF
jgi:hypothetical protein